ncbi:hypothetical protein HanRHA438_Chr17g0828801 [Helianthus annuus]|nr:hypothetical protein HanHA300_Chr17g0666641 [Helianthus annuus]KAJ0448660.1 hypothetical protein HanHA89_Chr17g0719531 [Helianthus annuus]KAJ0827697.1 hypothetical protein HanRHA438_Chr17g0828801 [Helianthus annuus]
MKKRESEIEAHVVYEITHALKMLITNIFLVEISKDIIRGKEWEFTEPSSIQSSILQLEDYCFWWVKPLKRSIRGFWFLETISGGLKSITVPVLLTGLMVVALQTVVPEAVQVVMLAVVLDGEPLPIFALLISY